MAKNYYEDLKLLGTLNSRGIYLCWSLYILLLVVKILCIQRETQNSTNELNRNPAQTNGKFLYNT